MFGIPVAVVPYMLGVSNDVTVPSPHSTCQTTAAFTTLGNPPPCPTNPTGRESPAFTHPTQNSKDDGGVTHTADIITRTTTSRRTNAHKRPLPVVPTSLQPISHLDVKPQLVLPPALLIFFWHPLGALYFPLSWLSPTTDAHPTWPAFIPAPILLAPFTLRYPASMTLVT